MTDTNNIIASEDNRGRRRSRRDSGYVTVVVLFFLLVFAVAMSSLASLTTTQLRNSRQGLVKAKALTLAEAGMDDAVQRLGPNGKGPDYKGTTPSGATPNKTTLDETTGVPFGTFDTTVTWVDIWKRKIVSTGETPDKGSLTLTAIVEIEKIKFGEDKAAIKSNGTIDINGTADINTVPATDHNANAMSNGALSAGGSSTVDGALISYSGVTSGVGYVPNVKLDTPIQFLSDSMTAAMRIDWKAKAVAGGTTNGNVNRTTIFAGSQYINGNIKLTGSDLVTLGGGGDKVVYVDGDVELSGGTLISGVTLIVTGIFKQSGQSVYKIVPGLPTPALFVYNDKDNDGVADAGTGITLRGGGENDAQGIIYGIKGDVVVAGGSTLTGAIYAGDPNAGVKSAGNFTLNYPLGMAANDAQPGSAFVIQLFEF